VIQIFGGIRHNVAMRSCFCNPCRIAAHRWSSLIRSTATPFDRLAYGNEGARQKGRALLPAMTSDHVDALLSGSGPRTAAQWLSVAMGRHF
jgi:hypothetical protein